MADQPHDGKPVGTLTGFKEPEPGPSLLTRRGGLVAVKAEFRPDAARAGRAVGASALRDDDIVEIEFVEGQRLWVRGEEYRRTYGGAPSRGTAGEETLLVPDALDLLPEGMQSRGPVKWAIASLKLLGVDLAGRTATSIGQGFDRKHDKGLQRCTLVPGAFQLDPLTAAEGRKLPADRPHLLFVHGTASSTWGSFGELWSEARSRELAALSRAYGDRVLALEHATLSVSPVENALALARALPKGARLHLVSHSRGGLVGELLCRGNRASRMTGRRRGSTNGAADGATEPFTPDEIGLLDDEQWRAQRERLVELDKTLRAKRLTVERFVRVACPALGTTLASGRLDRWLSVIGSLAGRALPGSPLFETFADLGDFAAAVIQQRTEPASLPGLAAQMPDSPIIRIVNWPEARVSGDLTVIAGDIEPDAWWARLLVFATDRFYDGDHDLVVNTPSMYGGAKRAGRALLGFHKSPGVNHFNYFSNAESARQLVQALTTDSPEGFEALEKPVVEIARGAVSRGPGARPVVFVLPGIMGSELTVGADRVWVDVPDLVFGGLAKLGIDAKRVTPTRPVGRYYGALIEYLSDTHKVVPFPYDWRLPVEQEADRLAADVRRELEEAREAGLPVRLLVHSMGGLVARAMIARHEGLWRDLCAHEGGRLVMLGTPNGGSHAITELLVGRSSTLRRLALVDVKHSPEQLLEIISRFPGVLAMLPKDPAEDYFSPDTWRAYHARSQSGAPRWSLPRDEDLAGARAFRQLLDGAPVDPERMVYVAGSADVTPAGMRYDATRGCIELLASTRGDGRVTWDSGIPPGLPTYYLDVEHGDLAAHEDAFPAIAELLERGKTSRMTQAAPVSRAADELFPIPRGGEDLYPDEETLVAAAVGAGSRRRRARTRREARVRVRMVHGNLAFAAYPVAVGHYTGDTIVSAERYLDRTLEHELSKKSRLGLYPGPIGTNAVFVNPRLRDNPNATPKGAIVVGLGTAGALSASALTRSCTNAFLEYAGGWTQHDCGPGGRDDGGTGALGLTTLLIGTGAGGLSLADSVYALLRAVVATNRALESAGREERIADVEIIELWEDVAIQASKILTHLEHDPDLKRACDPSETLECSKGGQRRLSFEEAPDWWQRLQVLGGDEDERERGVLRFTATTRRARSEVRLLPTQRALVDRFVEDAVRTTSDNRTVSRTLFELLLPNEIKEQAPDQDDLVLLLDEASAVYPWELLEDPKANEGPFAVRHGLLRQLASQTFREGVQHASDDTALVVGDPVSQFVALPGAQREAKAVARALESEGRFSVRSLITPGSQDVVNALFERPYRLLHLAGHGVYRYIPPGASTCPICGQSLEGLNCPRHGDTLPRLTGMVLGDGVFLTPAEVRQMRQVPELVFVNCCHLGRIEPDSGRDTNERRDLHLIAANLSTEFIRMGVRAVVAAGWAVDDAAADTFARTLYTRMLAGERFGDAVATARKVTHERHERTNTWGAYHCYGDPDYRLVRDREPDRPGRKLSFVSAEEAVTQIVMLTAQLSTKAEDDVTWELRQLEEIVEHLKERGWADEGRVTIALARAYGEAFQFERAIDCYRRASERGEGGLSLSDVEQFANYLGRHAVEEWKKRAAGVAGRPAKRRDRAQAAGSPEETIDEALSLIGWLDGPGAAERGALTRGRRRKDPSPTRRGVAKRLALCGSAYKRLAWITSPPGEALQNMLDAYEQSYECSKDAGAPDAYPLLNTLFARLVLGWASGGTRSKAARKPTGRSGAKRKTTMQRADLQSGIKEAGKLLAPDAPRGDFWAAVMPIDLALLEALAGRRVDEKGMTALAARYREVRKLASAREFASVMDQLEFLETMAVATKRNDVAKALGALRRSLEARPR